MICFYKDDFSQPRRDVGGNAFAVYNLVGSVIAYSNEEVNKKWVKSWKRCCHRHSGIELVWHQYSATWYRSNYNNQIYRETVTALVHQSRAARRAEIPLKGKIVSPQQPSKMTYKVVQLSGDIIKGNISKEGAKKELQDNSPLDDFTNKTVQTTEKR